MDSKLTIGSDGCLLTCLSMLATGYGEPETPATLNQKLRDLGPGRGFQGALYAWAGLAQVHPDIALRNLVLCRSTPAPMAEIDAALDAGDPVIVELDQSPAPGLQNHWVLIFGRLNGDYLMHDPWPLPAESGAVTVASRYGFGGDISKVITAAAFFHSSLTLKPSADTAAPVGLRVANRADIVAAGGLALRGAPNGLLIARLAPGTALESLDTAAFVRSRLGQEDRWLNVRVAGVGSGFVAAWLVEASDDAAGPPEPGPEAVLVSVADDPDIRAAGGLALRVAPGGQMLMRLPAGTVLAAQEPAEEARAKAGRQGQWLRVQTGTGEIGYVAAWLVGIAAAQARSLPLVSALQPPLRIASQTLHLRVVRPARGAGRRPAAPLRARPGTSKIIALLGAGSHLTAIGSPHIAAARIGRRGAWLRVVDDQGRRGYVSAMRVRIVPAPETGPARRRGDVMAAAQEPDTRPTLVVRDDPDVHAAGGLAVREQPRINARLTLRVPAGTVLSLRTSAAEASALVGSPNAWLAVCTADGQVGYCSAAYLDKGPVGWDTPSVHGASPDMLAQRTLITSANTRLHDARAADAPGVWQVPAGTPVLVTEPGDGWQSQVGQADAFIQIQTHAFKSGYARGTQLVWPASADARNVVEDAPLPKGVSAWLYGVHDAFDRGLFAGSGRRGWVLFTEIVGSRSGNVAYEDWSEAGYGVIVRLNHDYGGSGTIPVEARHDEFAAQCADWVRGSRGNLIWVIGNEMNNPREWPNQPASDPGANLADEITPEAYARCFNKVRTAIRAVQPRAMVVPGALDCFQGPRMSCRVWFERMLGGIDDLDGFALHCYTNGYSAELVQSLATFDNEPMRWQYYHFRAYSTLLDPIPAKWRRRPVFITEADPHGSDPWSGDQNSWIQAAYAEIERHNRQPHAHQIRALVLYRWSTDDQYTLQRRPGAQRDLHATIASTDYRWRA